MKTYRIGYFSKRINAYTDKYVRANNYEEAIKKSRIKNIEDIEEAGEPQTNEKWFCNLPTEEKAKRIINIAVNSDCDYETIVRWLKQPHTNKAGA